jgi:hypothetical protein
VSNSSRQQRHHRAVWCLLARAVETSPVSPWLASTLAASRARARGAAAAAAPEPVGRVRARIGFGLGGRASSWVCWVGEPAAGQRSQQYEEAPPGCHPSSGASHGQRPGAGLRLTAIGHSWRRRYRRQPYPATVPSYRSAPPQSRSAPRQPSARWVRGPTQARPARLRRRGSEAALAVAVRCGGAG